MLFVHVFSNDTVNVLSDGNVVAGVENIISSRLGDDGPQTTAVFLLRRFFCVHEVEFELDTNLLYVIFRVNLKWIAFMAKSSV